MPAFAFECRVGGVDEFRQCRRQLLLLGRERAGLRHRRRAAGCGRRNRHDGHLVDRECGGERLVRAGLPGAPPPRITADDQQQRDHGHDDPGDGAPALLDDAAGLRHAAREFVLFELVSFCAFHCLAGGISALRAASPGPPRSLHSRGPLRPALFRSRKINEWQCHARIRRLESLSPERTERSEREARAQRSEPGGVQGPPPIRRSAPGRN